DAKKTASNAAKNVPTLKIRKIIDIVAKRRSKRRTCRHRHAERLGRDRSMSDAHRTICVASRSGVGVACSPAVRKCSRRSREFDGATVWLGCLLGCRLEKRRTWTSITALFDETANLDSVE